MKVGTRILLVLALSLAVAGSATLIVNIMAFQQAPFPTWESYRDAFLEELDVSQDGVIDHLREHPEELFTAPGDSSSSNGVTLNEASEAVQQHAIRHAVNRSRNLTALVIGVVATGALLAGWVLAARIRRPIHQMIERARVASAVDPGMRFALEGPEDEIKELADTFDDMLERISRSYGSQRRFAAQVSHELRTPLATTCSEVEMLLADVDDPTVRTRLQAIAAATGRAERLVAQLLVLSRTETRDLDRAVFAFDELVGNVLGRAVENPPWHGLRLDFELAPTTVAGDRALLETLVRNLIDNAGRHNRPDGWVHVAVRQSDDSHGALLEVSNAVLPRRRESTPADPPGDPHTGLSIVAAVLDAHEGDLEWRHAADHVSARVQLPAGPLDAAPSVATHARVGMIEEGS